MKNKFFPDEEITENDDSLTEEMTGEDAEEEIIADEEGTADAPAQTFFPLIVCGQRFHDIVKPPGFFSNGSHMNQIRGKYPCPAQRICEGVAGLHGLIHGVQQSLFRIVLGIFHQQFQPLQS